MPNSSPPKRVKIRAMDGVFFGDSDKDGESNANVLRWINEFIDELDRIIEIYRIGEERRR
jgi:hypothetical protein